MESVFQKGVHNLALKLHLQALGFLSQGLLEGYGLLGERCSSSLLGWGWRGRQGSSPSHLFLNPKDIKRGGSVHLPGGLLPLLVLGEAWGGQTLWLD